jgi:guanylate kinase
MSYLKRVLIIAGPTGSGESTITNELIKRYPVFTRLVTATTREPRLNEVDTVDYYFFDEEGFKREVSAGNILEHTFVPGRAVYYGTYKHDLEKKLAEGKNIIVNPDVVGARYYKDHYNATTIFIKTESIDILKKRLKDRDPDISNEELTARLKAAQYELDNEESFYDHVILNKDGALENTVQEVQNILKTEGYPLS